MVLRVVSAAILGPLVLAAIWFGFPWIDLVAAVAAPLIVSEWIGLTRGHPLMRTLAIVYSMAAIVALLWLRHQPADGRETILWVVACVWAMLKADAIVPRRLCAPPNTTTRNVSTM